MINFYPGPSKTDPGIPTYVAQACRTGIISQNHRSEAFMKLMKETIHQIRVKLEVPDSYKIVFTSSATECWEIIAQSLIERKSIHLYNGDFGRKWLEQTNLLKPESLDMPFSPQQSPSMFINKIPEDIEMLCITQNETSNGTSVSNRILNEFRVAFPDKLIAIDATSSMAGIYLDFHNADIWYASVQKCFGLPSGLAVMILSERAVEKTYEINEDNYYNSLIRIIKNADKLQTTHTPNILDIYLLKEVLNTRPSIRVTDMEIVTRFEDYVDFFNQFHDFEIFVKNEELLSRTVFTLTGNPEVIAKIKKLALKYDIVLGNGYGDLRSNSFRIANFPVISHGEVLKLQAFFTNYFK